MTGEVAQAGRSNPDRERVSMRINPFLEFLRAFFHFFFAFLGRGGGAA